MANWIKAQDKFPEPHQHILATITENGKPVVVACWYCQDHKIIMKERPNAQTYSYAIVQAWMLFPEADAAEEILEEVAVT